MPTTAPSVAVSPVESSPDHPEPGPCPPRTAAARALMDRMQRLADRRVAEAQCPIPLPPLSPVAATPKARPTEARDLDAAETPEQRDQAFAAKLASILDDPESLGYYEHLARRSREGKFLPRRSHLERRDTLVTKARQIASRKAPLGPIRNPAACFVGWVKGLG